VSDVPTPKLSDAPFLRNILVLFGRGLIYALAFWTVYRAMIWVYPPHESSTDTNEGLQQRYTTQMDSYDEQTRKARQMLDESEKQQARMSVVITKQEEQSKRFDAILERWEKQAGLRK
jgi:hypothetical protein